MTISNMLAFCLSVRLSARFSILPFVRSSICLCLSDRLSVHATFILMSSRFDW